MTALNIIRVWKDQEYGLSLSEAAQHQQAQTARDLGNSLNHNETLVRDQAA